MKKSTFDLEQNVASLLCYAGWFVTGIIFLVCEKEDKVVRFHALQSILWFGLLAIVSAAVSVVGLVIGWIPILGALTTGLLGGALGLINLVSWLILMLTAYQGKRLKIPVIGAAAAKQVGL